MVVDLNLFEVEINWEGKAWGEVKLVKAMVLWVAVMRPPPHLHYFPNQLRATTVRAPTMGRYGQAHGLPGWVMS